MKFISITNIRLHKYLLSVGLIALLTYSLFVFYKLMFQLNDIENALQLSSFAIQSGMLFFILIGFRFARKNIDVSFLLNARKKSTYKLHLLSILLFILIGILIVFPIVGFTNIYYFIINPSNLFYHTSSLFFFNQWFLPFIIMGLIGYIVGINANTKFSYIALMLIWILLSPTNQDFVFHLLSNTNLTKGFSLLKNLSIAITEPSELYRTFFGMELYWKKKGILLLILLMLVFISINTLRSNNWKKINLVMLTFSLVIYSLVPGSSLLGELNKNRLIEDFKTNIQYYKQEEQSLDKTLFDYKIGNYDMSIRNTNNFSINLDMRISNTKKNEIAFTLYKGFKILEVNVLKDNIIKKTDFTQEGDYTKVFIPQELKGKSFTLNVIYVGNSSFSNPISSEHVYLPANFAWIPSNNNEKTHFVFGNQYLSSSFQEETKSLFRVRYEGDTEIDFINLDQINKSYYEGEAVGISLIIGELAQRKLKDKYTIFYPLSWFNYHEEFDDYIREFEEKLQLYNQIIKMNYELPEKIVILPSIDLNDSFMFKKSFSDKRHIIVQIDPKKLTQSIPLNTTIPYQIDAAFNKKISYDSPDKFAHWLLFNSFLGSNLSGEFDDQSPSVTFKNYQQTLVANYLNPKYEEILNSMLQYNNERLSDDFLSEWRNLILNNRDDGWERLGELIKTNDMRDDI